MRAILAPPKRLDRVLLGGFLSKEDVNRLLGDLGEIGAPTKTEAIDRLLRNPVFDPRNALAFLDVDGLSVLCRARGLSDSGGRAALLGRLSRALVQESLERKTRRSSPLPTWWRSIHPSIQRVAKSRFATHHRADAVFSAMKLVNVRVREYVRDQSQKDLDGVDLMRQAFSPNHPIITLAKVEVTSGQDEQQGYMDIFAGAMSAIRNPKAHELADIDEERAMHHLFLASLLMHKLDEAGVP